MSISEATNVLPCCTCNIWTKACTLFNLVLKIQQVQDWSVAQTFSNCFGICLHFIQSYCLLYSVCANVNVSYNTCFSQLCYIILKKNLLWSNEPISANSVKYCIHYFIFVALVNWWFCFQKLSEINIENGTLSWGNCRLYKTQYSLAEKNRTNI